MAIPQATEPSQTASDSPQAAFEPLLVEACAAHRRGDLDRAEGLYHSVLARDSRQPDALHLLGLIIFQRGDRAAALASIRKAIAQSPDKADYHFNLGKILRTVGDLGGAIASYQRAQSLEPDNAGILLNLGNCWRQAEQPAKAEACYRRAVALDPTYGAAHNNLGTLCRADGRLAEAVTHYRQAVALDGAGAAVWENLAKALTDLGEPVEALVAYRKVTALDPGRQAARHMIAALEGRTPAQAPADYVRDLFDDYATRFEAHLTGDLDYRVPSLLPDLLERLRPETARFERALDLGCGTGLVGQALRDRVARFEGLDLSAKMLAQAEAKGCYDDLIQGDAVGHLRRAEPGTYDLILAADVLIYLGDVAPLLAALARALGPEGLFLCSVEALQEPDEGYRLRPSGRHAHGRDYLASLAAEHGLTLVRAEEIPLRKDGDRPLPGLLLAFAHP